MASTKLILVISVVLAAQADSLRCYSAIFDCFPECVPQNATGKRILVAFQVLVFTDCELLLGSSSCEFVQLGDSEQGTHKWKCDRNYDSCSASNGIPPSCKSGVNWTAMEVVECNQSQSYCFTHFREPQNSLHGKQAVWGFEAVFVKGCASTCENVSQSIYSGIGKECCTTDLCNGGNKIMKHMSVTWLAFCSLLIINLH
mmetsp:Transcript_15778/g.19568  ORF Transcript_15778/g.19568 Transcript_15778/m.19568 type:complete len:200 (-) Transcript_15778:856-1455(-)